MVLCSQRNVVCGCSVPVVREGLPSASAICSVVSAGGYVAPFSFAVRSYGAIPACGARSLGVSPASSRA